MSGRNAFTACRVSLQGTRRRRSLLFIRDKLPLLHRRRVRGDRVGGRGRQSVLRVRRGESQPETVLFVRVVRRGTAGEGIAA